MAKPTSSVATRTRRPAVAEGLNAVSFVLSRAYYRYVRLLQHVLVEMELDANLRPGMGHVLFALFEQDDRIIKDLVQRVDLSPSTLSGILARMSEFGLIERHRDLTDGRAVRVRLTELGKSLQARCLVASKRVNTVLCAELTGKEMKQLKHGLQQMIDAIRQDELNCREARMAAMKE